MKVLSLEQGDIVLLRFPFSNQIDYKIRPALVVSNNGHNKSSDCWFCPITTKKAKRCISIEKHLAEGKLDRKSFARTDVIATMDKDSALKKIGKVRQEKINEIRQKLKEHL